jgi:hypothetical protein
MAIDEPLDAVEATFEAEERASSPLTGYIGPAAEILGLIPGLNLAVGAVAKAASLFIKKQSQDRFKALLSVLVDEMKRVNAKLADFEKTDQDREQFQQEFPNLVLDGLRKAEQIRATERVQSLGHILGHAYQEGPRKSLDLAEELMRVAMSLDEQDIVVLSWLCDGLRQYYSTATGQVDHEHTNSFWGQVDQHGRTHTRGLPVVPHGMATGDVMSCCAKLQGFGLLVQVRQSPGKVDPSTLPYSPLKRGYDFLEYIQGASAS